MRRPIHMLSLLTAATLALSGCAAVDDAVDQAEEFVSEGLQRLQWCTAAFRLGNAVGSRDVEAARNAVDDLQANAPDELVDELALIVEAVEGAEQGDLSGLQSQEVRDVGQRVLDVAKAQCDPTTRPE